MCAPSYTYQDVLTIPNTFRGLSDLLTAIIDYSTTFGRNQSSFATFGSVITSVHFKQTTEWFDLGILLLIGPISSGKTSCLEVLIAGAGRVGKISRCTTKGICEQMRSKCSPIHMG